MGDDIRTKAITWLDDNVPAGAVITSDGATAQKFTALTNLTHAGLVKQWKTQETKPPGKRSVVTSCNSFAGEYARAVVKIYLGAIDPHAHLKSIKKDHAWVDATAEGRPKKGDIVKEKGQHVFVSVNFREDGKWETVMGGQGGPQYAAKSTTDPDGTERWPLIGGRDLIKRIDKDAYEPGKLEGWIDIELITTDPDQPAPPPVPKTQTGTGTTGSLWLNQDDDVAHPDSPAGAGGPGNFRAAGTVQGDPFGEELPVRGAPAMRAFDPLDVYKWQEDAADERLG
jgi:hypothetical protein